MTELTYWRIQTWFLDGPSSRHGSLEVPQSERDLLSGHRSDGYVLYGYL